MPTLYPLFSGSKGNAYFLRQSGEGILIDCGRSAKQILASLQEQNIPQNAIKAIFITHEHIDHVQGLKKLSSLAGVKVYASAGTIRALEEKNLIGEKKGIIPIDKKGTELDFMKITPFHISHDCADGLGYKVETSDGRKTAFATDTGVITREISSALKGCDTVVLESNHDVRMLQNGSYPYILKRRILSDSGHLSNDQCTETAVKLLKSGTTRLFLAHLSEANNFPELAEQTAVCRFKQEKMKKNVDYKLCVLGVNGGKRAIY